MTEAYGVKNDRIKYFQPRYELDGSADVGEALEQEAEVIKCQDYLIQRIVDRTEDEAPFRPVFIFQGVESQKRKEEVN